MKVWEVMTPEPVCCRKHDSASAVAQVMKTRNIGAVPVIFDHAPQVVIGMVTDRDLCCRVLAERKDPEITPIEECMTRDIVTCHPEDPVFECEQIMQQHQVRRVPVVDLSGRCVGIVTAGDLALHVGASVLKRTMAAICQPPETANSQAA
jgi:CBS domain-containing protein